LPIGESYWLIKHYVLAAPYDPARHPGWGRSISSRSSP
jgi:hypothetical protein